MRRSKRALAPALPGILSAAVVLTVFVALAAIPSRAAGEDLISGIGLTQLTVYDQRPAPDGMMSGSPHVHAVTDEGYYVMSGKGSVELHDLANGFRTVDLSPGRYLQFPPGTSSTAWSTRTVSSSSWSWATPGWPSGVTPASTSGRRSTTIRPSSPGSTGLAQADGAQGRPRPAGRGRPRLRRAPRAVDERPGRLFPRARKVHRRPHEIGRRRSGPAFRKRSKRGRWPGESVSGRGSRTCRAATVGEVTRRPRAVGRRRPWACAASCARSTKLEPVGPAKDASISK